MEQNTLKTPGSSDLGASSESALGVARAVSGDAHSPLPWRLAERESFDGTRYINGVVGPDGANIRVEWFTLSGGPEVRANSAFIVRAVNNHDSLLATLKAARAALLDHGDERAIAPIVDRIDATLAAAEGNTK